MTQNGADSLFWREDPLPTPGEWRPYKPKRIPRVDDLVDPDAALAIPARAKGSHIGDGSRRTLPERRVPGDV